MIHITCSAAASVAEYNAEFVAEITDSLFPERPLFGVFLVKMTALQVVMTAGKLTALKPVFIAPVEQRLRNG